MIDALIQWFYRYRINALLMRNPASFFHKLNALDWYKNALHLWVDENVEPEMKADIPILEVACETGSLSAYMHTRGFKVTAVDLSAEMIKQAKIKNNDIDFQQADASDLPFDAEEFDYVFCASLINIAPQAQQIMNEMARVCKKSGKVCVLVPAKEFSDVNLDGLVKTLGLSGFSQAALKAWHQKPPKMSEDEVVALLEESQLKPVLTAYYLNNMLLSISAIKT